MLMIWFGVFCSICMKFMSYYSRIRMHWMDILEIKSGTFSYAQRHIPVFNPFIVFCFTMEGIHCKPGTRSRCFRCVIHCFLCCASLEVDDVIESVQNSPGKECYSMTKASLKDGVVEKLSTNMAVTYTTSVWSWNNEAVMVAWNMEHIAKAGSQVIPPAPPLGLTSIPVRMYDLEHNNLVEVESQKQETPTLLCCWGERLTPTRALQVSHQLTTLSQLPQLSSALHSFS